MNILITGFKPFLENKQNPTEELMKLFPKSIHGNPVIKLVLPVSYDNAFEHVRYAIEEYQPDVIVHFGLASDRNSISLERVAVNLEDSKHPDNDGVIRTKQPIKPQGNETYQSTLPLEKITDRLMFKQIPVEYSSSAGTYICNSVMYQTLHHLAKRNIVAQAGFVHVPQMKEESQATDALPLDVILEGAIDIVKSCIL